jgi:dipeptidyl aminopeptidase/acylaminoacyl peptidase
VKEKKLKNCIINICIVENFSSSAISSIKYIRLLNRTLLQILIGIALLLAQLTFSQDVSLEYIFQDTSIINPRPSLKFINSGASKMYYYADDDHNGSLSLFDYNYVTDETFKYSDTGADASEFVIMKNGNALSVIGGEVYISRDFVNSRTFTKDIQLTSSEKYEYSPVAIDDIAIYRRGGNYFLIRFDSTKAVSNELQLTNDESDSISYQLIANSGTYHENSRTLIRLMFARYDNSAKNEYIIPDYSGEFVKAERRKRGISKVKYFEYAICYAGKDSLLQIITEFKYPDSVRYSTNYVSYSPNAKEILLDAETLDRHNRKLFIYDNNTRLVKEIYSESDTAWFERHSNTTSFISNDEILFESEISGYNSLYRINKDGSGFALIAGGEYTILESVVDRTKRKVYFSANKEHPYEYFIYETDLDDNSFRQVTSESGDVQELRLSGDGRYLFYTHSYINKPNELYYVNLEDYTGKQVTSTISPKFSQVEWNVPELINFNSEEDGALVYAFVYKPQNYNPKKKYPLICFAHGSGYLQNVTYGFSPYGDNFLVNTFLTSQGYVVLDVDFRGSLGYGREFRNKTYHNLGYWEVSDYISGINYLNLLGLINKEKVGIYGGSYGGFITLMSMFRSGDVFKCGAALRAVSDWGNYFYANRWYTLARLGDYNNEENKEYYRISSPITYTEGLKGSLLLLHGMLDDNVYFQQSAQLTQKLIELHKDFEVMYYPKENHGFRLQSSWLDQYKRIWKFFEKNLK